jgi:hypothetical protein
MSKVITQLFDIGAEQVTSELDTNGTIGWFWNLRAPHGYRLLTVVGAMVEAVWENGGGGAEIGQYVPVDFNQAETAVLKFIFPHGFADAPINGHAVVAWVRD